MIERVLVSLCLFILSVWKCLFSPLLAPCCRYYPSCSDYAAIALKRHGLIKGLVLAGRRILRCNSLFEGGLDPVPEKWQLCIRPAIGRNEDN